MRVKSNPVEKFMFALSNLIFHRLSNYILSLIAYMNSSFLLGWGGGGSQVTLSSNVCAPADNLQATQPLPSVFCNSVVV